jgi:hypothetical protein
VDKPIGPKCLKSVAVLLDGPRCVDGWSAKISTAGTEVQTL